MSKKRLNLDEVHHVFDAHTVDEIYNLWKSEIPEYTKAELVDIIFSTKEKSLEFEQNWLVPILDELEELRLFKFKIEEML